MKKFRLPERDKMEKMLFGIYGDIGHLRQHLYPDILAHAGQEGYGMGIASMLLREISGYCKAQGVSKILHVMVNDIPRLIFTLIEDKEVARDAHSHFKTLI